LSLPDDDVIFRTWGPRSSRNFQLYYLVVTRQLQSCMSSKILYKLLVKSITLSPTLKAKLPFMNEMQWLVGSGTMVGIRVVYLEIAYRTNNNTSQLFSPYKQRWPQILLRTRESEVPLSFHMSSNAKSGYDPRRRSMSGSP
jgi:hypothetical protein